MCIGRGSNVVLDIMLINILAKCCLLPDIVKDSRKPYLSSHVPRMMPIVAFEVRGLLVVDFAFGVSGVQYVFVNVNV